MSKIIAYCCFKNGDSWISISNSLSDLHSCLVHNNIMVYVFELGQFVVQPYSYLTAFECKTLSALLNYLCDLGLIDSLRFDFFDCDVTLGQ